MTASMWQVREAKRPADRTWCDEASTLPPCWVAGPSKTADIQQALVIGAHGPRRLAVLPYG